jgi:hypothetical protein
LGTPSRAELRVELRDSMTDFVQDIEMRFGIRRADCDFPDEKAVNKQQKGVPRGHSTATCARTQHFAQDQAQVERPHMDQLPLQNILVSALCRLKRYSFEKKKVIVPLQSADVLAWTIYQ